MGGKCWVFFLVGDNWYMIGCFLIDVDGFVVGDDNEISFKVFI